MVFKWKYKTVTIRTVQIESNNVNDICNLPVDEPALSTTHNFSLMCCAGCNVKNKGMVSIHRAGVYAP
jgi:hypothetical protein